MQTPVPVTSPPRPRWQVLLRRTRLRLQVATVARRGLGTFLVLAAAYGAFFLGTRLTGLLVLAPEPMVLVLLPILATLIAGLLPHQPTLRDAARAVDRYAKTDDLFLTMMLLEGSVGEFKPLVAANAEAKAATIQTAAAVPWGMNRRLTGIAMVLFVLVACVHFVPQLDPFGKVDAAQQARKDVEKLDESKKETTDRVAQIERENLSDAEAKEVQQALDKFKAAVKAARPQQKQANAKLLADAQKAAAENWRKISVEKLKELLSHSSMSQQFGSSSAVSKKWLSELQAGSTESIKKELSDLQMDLEELGKTKDPVKQAQLNKQIREKLDALTEFARDQAGSKALAAALKRVEAQMRMAAKMEDAMSAKEAMQAAAESMKLAEKELQQMAQSAKELKELEKALEAMQMAKQLNNSDSLDGAKMEGAQTMEEYAAMFEKMMKDQNLGGEGEGEGGGSEEDESKKSEFKTEMSKSHITKGKVLLTLKTKGQGEKVDVKEKYRTAIRDVKQGVSEAILQEEIPPGYHEGIRGYFDSLQETPNAK